MITKKHSYKEKLRHRYDKNDKNLSTLSQKFLRSSSEDSITNKEFYKRFIRKSLREKRSWRTIGKNIKIGEEYLNKDLEKSKNTNKIEKQFNNLKDKIQIENEKDVYDYICYYNVSTDILLKTYDIAYELFNIQNIKFYILDDDMDNSENLIIEIYIKDMEPADVSNKLSNLYEKLYDEFPDEEINKIIINMEFL